MRSKSQGWLVVVGLLALAPVGVRAVTWTMNRAKPVDVASAQAGEVLFNHEWVANDPLANGGDGLGPVANANSCVFCHNQAKPGGGGELEQNVTTFGIRSIQTGATREGVVHALGGETLRQVHPDLPDEPRVPLEKLLAPVGIRASGPGFRLPPGVRIGQLNTPALFGDKLINDIPDSVLIAQERAERLKYALAPAGSKDLPVGRAARLTSGRVGHFGWKGQTADLLGFVQAACANELGLGNPSAAQPTPLWNPTYMPASLDLTQAQCNQITEFVASLPQPVERTPSDTVEAAHATAGKKLFSSVGCAECHTANLGSVAGIYSDLLLHRMGADLEGSASYYDGPLPFPGGPEPPDDGPARPDEWRTPPLWGVADSAPYLHDGRAATLEDAIKLHSGQGLKSAQRYAQLTPVQQTELVSFLKTLRAP